MIQHHTPIMKVCSKDQRISEARGRQDSVDECGCHIKTWFSFTEHSNLAAWKSPRNTCMSHENLKAPLTQYHRQTNISHFFYQGPSKHPTGFLCEFRLRPAKSVSSNLSTINSPIHLQKKTTKQLEHARARHMLAHSALAGLMTVSRKP